MTHERRVQSEGDDFVYQGARRLRLLSVIKYPEELLEIETRTKSFNRDWTEEYSRERVREAWELVDVARRAFENRNIFERSVIRII